MHITWHQTFQAHIIFVNYQPWGIVEHVPLISVVIPLYNKELYIQRTIQSVLSQTFPDYELIIIDSSTDKSPDIVRKFDDPRIIHVQIERAGAAKTRNIGVSYARSDLVAFLDADDEWSPDHLEQLHHLSISYPDAGLYATPYIKIRPDGKYMVMVFAGIPKPPWQGYIPRYYWTCAHGDVPVHSSSCAMRKEVFNQMKGFREELVIIEDQDLWGRIALCYPVAFCWEGNAIYHTEAEGRICNESHVFVEDAYSSYLEDLLRSDCLTPKQMKDIRVYIQKRKRMIWFSNLFFGNTLVQEQGNGVNRSYIWFGKKITNTCVGVITRSMNNFYNSRYYSMCRRIKCLIHGWHIPQEST